VTGDSLSDVRPRFDHVVLGESDTSFEPLVRLDVAGARCSGVRVAPDRVWTALHCVAEITAGPYVCRQDGTLSETHPGGVVVRLRSPDELQLVDASGPSRVVEVRATSTEVLCNADFAELVTEVSSAPFATLAVDGPTAGSSVRVVGWGMIDDGTFPSVPHARETTVSAIGPDTTFGELALGSHEARVGVGPCGGDSGGPVLDAAGHLVGLVARGSGRSAGIGTPPCFGDDASTVITLVGDLDEGDGPPEPFVPDAGIQLERSDASLSGRPRHLVGSVRCGAADGGIVGGWWLVCVYLGMRRSHRP
jgi:hypothetical protein